MSTRTAGEAPAFGTRETWYRAVWECRAAGSRAKYDTEPREFTWSGANSGVWCGGHAVYGSRAVAEVNGWFRSPLKAVEYRLADAERAEAQAKAHAGALRWLRVQAAQREGQS